MTFYEDSRFREKSDMSRAMKRPMTLDLDSTKYNKKCKVTSLLTSPDLNMLKLASPELERMIIAQHGLVTSTPTPSQCMYPQKHPDDSDFHSRDFADALGHAYPPDTMSMPCQQQQQPPPCTVAMDYNGYGQQHNTMIPPPSTTCYNPPNYYSMEPNPVSIKEEPQTVPCMGATPPMSPIDMENQERIKLERKRMRNRIAASKCRRRKLERIARLEDKVSLLKGENTELSNVVNQLREQVCGLKQQVMDHMRLGCEILNFQPDLQF